MSEYHKDKTAGMIAVMQAYVDGKPIECRTINAEFSRMRATPVWNWDNFEYRIAAIPDSINWDHVSPEWKYMARNARGDAYLYVEEPIRDDFVWRDKYSNSILAEWYSSYTKGTVTWKDSLVKRPD